MMKKRSLFFAGLLLLVSGALWADVPGIPSDPLAPNLRFRDFDSGKPSLLEQAGGRDVVSQSDSLPDGWSKPASQAVKSLARPMTLEQGQVSLSPRGDAAQTGVFGPSAEGLAGKEVRRFSFDSPLAASPMPLGGDLLVPCDGQLIRLDVTAGKARWQLRLDGTPTAPALWGDRVYVATDMGTLYCIDGSAGQILWKQNDGRRVYRGSPVVADGKLYVPDVNFGLRALDARTGDELWTRRMKRGMAASPLVAGGQLLVGGVDTSFTALNPTNGSKFWSGGAGGALYFGPSFDGSAVYFAGDDGVVVATKVKKVLPQWRSQPLGSPVSSPILDAKKGLIYLVTSGGKVCQLDAKTGQVALTADLGTPAGSQPVLLPDQLAVLDAGGTLHLLPLKSGAKRVALPLESVSAASPVYALGALWVPHGNLLSEVK